MSKAKFGLTRGNILSKIKNLFQKDAVLLSDEINYNICEMSLTTKIAYLAFYYIISYLILFIFYKSIVFSLLVSTVVSGFIMPLRIKKEVINRKKKLKIQFYDLLSALDVAMRSGENINTAFTSTLDTLLLTYGEKSDIVIEVTQILNWLNNNRPLKDAISNFADRSGVAEIINFSAVLNVINGKSDRENEVIRQTQKIISESLEIELEIDTIITDKKNEQNIMLVLPVVIVATMTLLGNGFMDSIHTTFTGRIVATIALIIFIASYYISTVITNIRV